MDNHTPFYHEKCPCCGYCRFCGRTDNPFKDHWESMKPKVGDTDNDLKYKILMQNTRWRKDQAVIPSSENVFYSGTADNFLTNDSKLEPRI